MNLTFIKDYKDIDRYRMSFNELAGLTFKIDFENWYQLGFWNDRYICYSYEDSGRIVSNVSISKMDLVIQGKRVNAIQIGTVMTHPDYRNKGLAAKLMNTVLEEYRTQCELFFLFANKSALGFYNKFDFSTARETMYSVNINVRGEKNQSFRRLDMFDIGDLNILKRLLKERFPVSSVFDVEHTEGILAWHCIYAFPKDAYYCESLDAIIIYKVKNEVLHLYDVICRSKIDIQMIIEEIIPVCVYEVVFHFTPDTTVSNIDRKPYITEDYTFFVKSNTIKLEGEFFFPNTAHA